MSAVRTRFAPSPTGHLHIGGARTALFAWLYARHTGGTFILRVEDTDAERSTAEYTRLILEAMAWLGLDWDEGPFFQSQRLDIYRSSVAKLVASGHAYWCACTPEELERRREQALAEGRKPKYDGTCRQKGLGPGPGRVVRFASPLNGVTAFDDMIKGRIAIDNAELDDLILLRSDNMPTYNFTVVIDDADMHITHVIRGDDHVNNTPRQIAIYEALDLPVPLFAHVPMILGADKTRLSKRHGATAVMAYQEMGYLPEALVNYLVRLSWSHGDQEIFTPDELISLFDIVDVGKAAAVFNPDKLLWLNHHYIMNGDPARLAVLLKDFVQGAGFEPRDTAYLERVVKDVRERTKTLKEMLEFGAFYFKETEPSAELKTKFFTPNLVGAFRELIKGLAGVNLADKAQVEEVFKQALETCHITFKQIAQPVRIALTGKTVSPGLFEIIATLNEQVVPRLKKALACMEEKT